MGRFLLFLLLLAAAAGGAFYAEQWNFFRPGPPAALGNATIVLIKPGEHQAAIAETLRQAGTIEYPDLFRLGVRLRGTQAALKAGEYAIPSRASMADIMGILIAGKSIQHKITVAEGLTSGMIYRIVAKDPVLVGSAGTEPAEGTLLPETYLFTRGATRAQILARMAHAQTEIVARMWRARAGNLPFKSPEEAMILASIVEKETAIAEERRHVASVFINRLRLGMMLQSDPTIIYGITKGYPLGRGIRQSEIASPTPYNTYAVAGLPPTPICNPGKDSIAAVLQPENTDDLYFVANGQGGHVFTPSIVEHEKNVARWRQIEQQAVKPNPAEPSPLTDVGSLRGTTDADAASAASAPAATPPPAAIPVVPPVRHARVRRRHRHHRR